jgi:sorbitol/mannitol transport system substrate-binding protein
MIIMQRLSPQWQEETGNTINWVVLEENVLRQRVTTDIATNGGQFDIVTIGSYEAPIWGKQGWLVGLNDLGDDYDYADLIPSVVNGLSYEGTLYAVPFYAESSFTFYRKDLFDQAGLTMPDEPTYDQIAEFAAKLTDKSKEQYGFCQRGKPGWGENMAFVGPMVNAFGGRWFDENWQPQLTSEPWTTAVNYYVENMNAYGPPGASANGHNENRALFATGHCAIWVDATSAAGYIYNPNESQVADKTAFAAAPIEVTSNGSGWFWAWALGIPSSSSKVDAAKSFLKWATSKDYVTMVGETEGWVAAPPGTRKSTYDNSEYQKAAPFAQVVYESIANADITKPTKDPVPYVGIQYVAIPEFQGIGTTVGQQIAAALAGQVTVEEALETAQASVERTMRQAGYTR